MKKVISLIVLFVFVFLIGPFSASAYVSVKGYFKKNGTYVAPYVRSNPNGLKYDNYSYKPSQGLYNSTYGTRDAYWDTPTYITDPDYYVGKSIYDSKNGISSSASSLSSTKNNVSTLSETIIVPTNATKIGNNWYCNNGYKTIYLNGIKNSCEKVTIPENATFFGDDWYCYAGYRTVFENGVKSGCTK